MEASELGHRRKPEAGGWRGEWGHKAWGRPGTQGASPSSHLPPSPRTRQGWGWGAVFPGACLTGKGGACPQHGGEAEGPWVGLGGCLGHLQNQQLCLDVCPATPSPTHALKACGSSVTITGWEARMHLCASQGLAAAPQTGLCLHLQ